MNNLRSRMFDIMLGLMLVLTPIFHIVGNFPKVNGWVAKFQMYQWGFFDVLNISSVQLLFVELAIVSLFLISMPAMQHRHFRDKPVILLFALCLLNVLIYPIGIQVFPYIFLGFILYRLVVCHIKDVRTIAYPMLIVSTLNTIMAIPQALGLHLDWLYGYTARVDGAMFLSSHMALYQAISIPMVYMLRPMLIIIPIAGLLLSGSYVPLIASLIGMTFLLRRSNLLSMPMMGIYGVVGLYLIYNIKGIIYKLSIRLPIWLSGLDFTLFGHKLGSFNHTIAKVGESSTTYSIYFTVFYYLGIAGAIVLTYYLIDRVNRFRKSKASKPFECLFASFMILALCGLSQSFLDFPRLAFTSIVLLASLEAYLMKGRV